MWLAEAGRPSYPAVMAADEPEAPKPSLRDDELEPMRRDRGFLVRLVAAAIVGIIAAAFVGYKLKHVASGCGAGLIRPGSSVIPSGDAH